MERRFRCAACGYEFSLPYGTGEQGVNLRCPKCGGLVHRAGPGGPAGRGFGGGGGGWGRNRKW